MYYLTLNRSRNNLFDVANYICISPVRRGTCSRSIQKPSMRAGKSNMKEKYNTGKIQSGKLMEKCLLSDYWRLMWCSMNQLRIVIGTGPQPTLKIPTTDCVKG